MGALLQLISTNKSQRMLNKVIATNKEGQLPSLLINLKYDL